MQPVQLVVAAGATPGMRSVSAMRQVVTTAVIAFLTLVDLFAAQAILPSLAAHYGTLPAATGLAVNAGTFGMAIAGLAVAFVGRRLNRRCGVAASLALLSVPTLLLSLAPTLTCFALLRVAQGILMATAFSLSLAHIAEQSDARGAALGSAAYVTGNVASNLVGRLLAAAAVDHVGLSHTFQLFAALNLLGAAISWAAMRARPATVFQGNLQGHLRSASSSESVMSGWRIHLADRKLRATFIIGFCILFAFIGTFTYVNFVLTAAPFAIHPMQLGLVYFVFLPALVTTPLAGRLVYRVGARRALRGSLALAVLALPCLVIPSLPLVLVGLALFASGTFFAQAVATGYVGRSAAVDRSAGGGLYLASYFLGGLAGSFLLGQAFDHLGWIACVFGVALALAAAFKLAGRLQVAEDAR